MSETGNSGGTTGDVWRRVRTTFDEKMRPQSHSSTSPVGCKIRAMALWPGRTLVPVIFLPGIMGSNLQNKGDKAWVPPNGIKEKLKELKDRSGQEPAVRQTQLTAEDCEVYDRNESIKLDANYLALDAEEAKRRHWGEVHAESYLGILSELEERLNYPFDNVHTDHPKPHEAWQCAMTPKKQKWTPKSPLTETEFEHPMGRIYFPVHACGYNWLLSNEESAKRVIERIDEIEKRIEGNDYYTYAGKVILVTHSMGGLVGRRVAQMIPDKILGVVHGVQPVTGAPAVYRRFKGGTETGGFFDIAGIGAAVVLGWDAADTTCVLGNSPGPMELLPTKHYPPGWLHITDGDKTIRLPESDPYEEIYPISAEDKWWGMVDPNLLDPAEKLKDKPYSPHEYFIRQLEKAQSFHNTVDLTCHPCTYAYYGDDPGQHSLGKVVWRTVDSISALTDEAVLSAPRTRFKLTGRTDIAIDGRPIRFTLDGKRDPGDGTVPTESGEAARQLDGILDVFGLQGFDHQFSYRDEIAQHTTLYAVAKLVQKIALKEDGTCERA